MPSRLPTDWPPLANGKRHQACLSTASGILHDLTDPEGAIIADTDVCVSGMRQRRYAGAVDAVLLDHWVHVAELAEEDLTQMGIAGMDEAAISLALAACHDLHEATMLDLPRGLKDLVGAVYKPWEDRWAGAYHRHYGLPWPLTPVQAAFVKRYDNLAAHAEAHALYPKDHPMLAYNCELYGGPEKLPPSAEAIDHYNSIKAASPRTKWSYIRRCLNAGRVAHARQSA